jgi:hypothetical protein
MAEAILLVVLAITALALQLGGKHVDHERSYLMNEFGHGKHEVTFTSGWSGGPRNQDHRLGCD